MKRMLWAMVLGLGALPALAQTEEPPVLPPAKPLTKVQTPDLPKPSPVGACFPHPGPVQGAAPAITHLETFHVPTRVSVKRVGAGVSMRLDPAGFAEIKLPVGRGMITGVHEVEVAYPAGKAMPKEDGFSGGWGSPVTFGSGGSWTEAVTLPKGPAMAGVILEIFETDIPPQHMWRPMGGKYKVLWRRELVVPVP